MADLTDRSFLIGNLSFLYRLIVASAPLLDFALDYAEGSLRSYYTKHLEEELNHDEMLKEDLYELGVVVIPPSHTAAAIAGSQYYFIAHEHAALLLGYMATLESAPFTVERVKALQALHKTELRALMHHAIHDPSHAVDLAETIMEQPANLRVRIWQNADVVKKNLAEVSQKLAQGIEVI